MSCLGAWCFGALLAGCWLSEEKIENGDNKTFLYYFSPLQNIFLALPMNNPEHGPFRTET